MANAPIQFDSVDIGTIGFKFEGDETTVASDCNGTLSVETEVQEVQKKCGATVVASISKPTEMTITIEAHLPVEVFRRVQGIKPMAELKEGVYAYGGKSAGEKFTLTAEILDLFTGESKLIAFPKAAINTGLTFSIEAGADELAYVEIETKAYQDELGNWYYEAFPTEATDVNKVEWLTNFTEATVKKSDPTKTTDITLDKSTVSVAVGADVVVNATLAPSTSTEPVTATSKAAATATASVAQKAVTIHGVKAGSTTVDITSGKITKTVTVTVTE